MAKTETEAWADYVKEQEKRDADLAKAYAEVEGDDVVLDTTTAERAYATRDNIVVSGASPSHVQAAVYGLSDDEDLKARAVDCADIAQTATREEYREAVLDAELDAEKQEKRDIKANRSKKGDD
jgi:hypothetical protein